ncbi:MAG: ATP synthase F1 subunit gamma [Candidatus Pacebacteria bacterium]|nr:ATP synthase F1 subunit gamma [Candidatus Paceibacterota bacterium]MCF7857036.1 ATP synthase F1 subunit gamma [Candidatus Paceibacterota bacterium]
MALKHIKNKIKSTERTSKVTKAMEAVSAVKMRKSQEKALTGRPYAEAAFRILENIARSVDVQHHTFIKANGGSKDCLIVITSDKGLAGSLNSAVLKESTRLLGGQSANDVELICFGKKGYEHFLRRGYTIPLHHVNMSDDVTIEDVQSVVTHVGKQFTLGHYKSVRVVYQHFLSTFEQNAIVRQILPISKEDVRLMIRDILPKHGKYSEQVHKQSMIIYTAEQSRGTVFDSIFSILVEIMLYHALLESKASEHSARMVAMKNATDKARDVMKLLTLSYNKKRQSVITAEVSEITGGIEAMKDT